MLVSLRNIKVLLNSRRIFKNWLMLGITYYLVRKGSNSLTYIVNIYYPSPITILELTQIIQKTVIKLTNNAIQPKIEIVDTGQKPLFREEDKNRIKVNIKKAIDFLGLSRLKSPEESIEEIVMKRLTKHGFKC